MNYLTASLGKQHFTALLFCIALPLISSCGFRAAPYNWEVHPGQYFGNSDVATGILQSSHSAPLTAVGELDPASLTATLTKFDYRENTIGYSNTLEPTEIQGEVNCTFIVQFQTEKGIDSITTRSTAALSYPVTTSLTLAREIARKDAVKRLAFACSRNAYFESISVVAQAQEATAAVPKTP